MYLNNDDIITKTFKKAAADVAVQDDRGKHSKRRRIKIQWKST